MMTSTRALLCVCKPPKYSSIVRNLFATGANQCTKQAFPLNIRRGYANLTETDLRPKDRRQKVVILGSGWAGYVCAKHLDPKKYRIVVISPRTYFVFTPLLNDTAVGTLEFRHVLESVRKANSHIEFIQGWADDVMFAEKQVTVEPSVLDPFQGNALTSERSTARQDMLVGPETKGLKDGGTAQERVPTFPVSYDKLIVAVGSYSQTFNTPGVKENAYFLKDVGDARRIRKRVLELFELANLPFVDDKTRSYLLHFAIVGGGPTGMEFAACLSDLLREDLTKLYPQLMRFIKITLYDVAPKVLPMFDAALADYAVNTYKRQNVDIRTNHHVQELRRGIPNDEDSRKRQDELPAGHVYTIRTKEDGDVGIGMCVWSTGLMNNPFVAKALNNVRRFPSKSASFLQEMDVNEAESKHWVIQRNSRTGSIIVDDHFRVQLQTEGEQNNKEPQAYMQDVFALGDCTMLSSGSLPATAQVANQEGQYLAKSLNKYQDPSSFDQAAGFQFHNRGVMTFLGSSKAIIQGPEVSREGAARGIKGWLAYLMWRGAYLTMTLSWRNKFLIPIQWLAVKVFGRSLSRF